MGIAELPSVDEEQIERYLKALCAEAEQHGQVRGGGWICEHAVGQGGGGLQLDGPTATHCKTYSHKRQMSSIRVFSALPPPPPLQLSHAQIVAALTRVNDELREEADGMHVLLLLLL